MDPKSTEAKLNNLTTPEPTVIVAEPQKEQKRRGRKPKPKPDPANSFKIVQGIVIVDFTL